MADYTLTAALNAASFPLVTRYQNRSIIIPQYDGRLRNPTNNVNSVLDNNPNNIPQILFCENIIPNADGILSVAYTAGQISVFPGAGVADDAFLLRDGDVNTWYFCPAQGMNYVSPNFGAPWVSTNPIAGAPVVPTPQVSLAEINGVTYVAYANTALLRWETTGNFTDVSASLVGASVGGIRAICSSGNYLILVYSDNSVKWSSLTDPLDFTPSAATGAGSQIPIDMKGPPSYVSSISGGFLVHCAENTVAAVYTQNVAQPWIFREVKNSGGLAFGLAGISRESSTGYIYQYSTYGLQQLDLRTAETIHPEITEFLSLSVLETFDTLTNLLTITKDYPFWLKIAFLAGRYLCVSYGSGENNYQYAFWYDTVLKRWGKLKIDHADLFSIGGTIYVLQRDGTVRGVGATTASSELFEISGTGVAIFGRYQLSRSAGICSQEVELEVLDGTQDVTVDVVVNYNGTSLSQIFSMLEYESVDNYRKFQKQIEGQNLSYIIKGDFKLSTILYTFTRGARM
jgi:hypothetical protein